MTAISQANDQTTVSFSKSKVATAQSNKAKSWGFSSDEWKQYESIMLGPSGIWYKNLNPTEVLGINAKSQSEREKYAELVVQQRHDRLERELAFERATQAAWKKLYPALKPVKDFDLTPFSPLKQQALTVNSGDRLIVFAGINDVSNFAVMPELLAIINTHQKVKLDIFVVGKNVNDITIRTWAKLNQVPMDKVSNGSISLNYGNTKYKQLSLSKKNLPIVLLNQNGKTSKVSKGHF